MRCLGLLPIALACGAAAAAQTGSTPLPIEDGQEVSASAEAAAGGLVGCYAIATSPGERLSVEVEPTGFAGEVRIARGALCNAAAVQARKAWEGDGPAALSLPAAGGRYLVLVSRAAPGPDGAFRLVVRRGGETAVIARSEPAPANPATPGPADPPAGEEVSVRRQLMLAQTEQRRVQLAEQEERRRAQEAEARRQEELAQLEWQRREAEAAAMRANQPDMGALIVGSFIQGFNDTIAQGNERAEVAEYYNSQIRELEAEHRLRQEEERARESAANARTAEQRAAAEENMRLARERMAQDRQEAASRPAGGGTQLAGQAGAPAPSPATQQSDYRLNTLQKVQGPWNSVNTGQPILEFVGNEIRLLAEHGPDEPAGFLAASNIAFVRTVPAEGSATHYFQATCYRVVRLPSGVEIRAHDDCQISLYEGAPYTGAGLFQSNYVPVARRFDPGREPGGGR